MKKIAILIIVLGTAIVSSLLISETISTKNNNVSKVLSSFSGNRLYKSTLAIDGMWCASCAVSAQYSLKSIPGVADAHVGFTKNLDDEGWVIYEPKKVTKEQITNAIEPYKATITSDVVYTETR